jgi:hypothetical protein
MKSSIWAFERDAGARLNESRRVVLVEHCAMGLGGGQTAFKMVERKAHCWLEWLPSIHDKPTRARGFQAGASMKMVHIPVGPEGDAFIGELLKFPAGRHDDDVDCASLLGRALDMAHPAVELPRPKLPGPIRGLYEMTWDEIHAQHERINRDRW